MRTGLTIMTLFAAALLAACAPQERTSTAQTSGQDLNSSNLDCSALTPAERALVTPRTGCVEIFRPEDN